MKFNLSDFLQLDTKELLTVNGGSPCSSSSGSPSGSSSGSPSGGSSGRPSGSSSGRSSNGSGAPSSSSTNSSDGGNGGNSNPSVTRNPNGTVTYHQKNGQSFTYRTQGNNNSSKNGNNDNSSKTVPEAWSGGSGSSGGGSCSTSTSNNPNGQGPSTTSSNPGGNQHKDTKIHSGGGTCTKTGGHSPVNPNPTNPDDVTSGGGTCSSKNDTDKVYGMFGQITDGSYADELTMQYYLKHFPWTNGEVVDSFMYGTYVDHNGVEQQCKFSTVGCKEIGSAKIGSEFLGENVSPMSIQNNCDFDKDGNLSADEIAQGLNNMLDEKFGDIFNIEYEEINSNINLEKLEEIANKNDTYVLGFAQNCHGGHWVVLEGYSQDFSGNITFNYDGTSDNDMANNRSFVLGIQNQSVSSEKYAITRIQTFTKVSK